MQMQTVALVFFVENYHIITGSIPKAAQEKRALLSEKPNKKSFRAIRHNTTTKYISKMNFPHLFPTWMRAGFAPVLCSAYLLLAAWVSEIAVRLRLALLTSFSSNTVSSWTTTNGLGKLQKTTAFPVPYQTLPSTPKLQQPISRNRMPERFATPPFCFCRWSRKFQSQQPTQLTACMHL